MDITITINGESFSLADPGIGIRDTEVIEILEGEALDYVIMRFTGQVGMDAVRIVRDALTREEQDGKLAAKSLRIN